MNGIKDGQREWSSADSCKTDNLESVNRSLLMTTNESLSATESDSLSKDDNLNFCHQNPDMGSASNKGYDMMLLEDSDSSKSIKEQFTSDKDHIMTDSSGNLCEIAQNDSRSHSVDMDNSRGMFDTPDNVDMAGTVDGESGLSTVDQANKIFESARWSPFNISEIPDAWLQNMQSESSFSEINKVTEENRNEVSADLHNISKEDQIKSPNQVLHSILTHIKSTVSRTFQCNSITPGSVHSKINWIDCSKCSGRARGIHEDVTKMRKSELESPIDSLRVPYNNFRNDISLRNLANQSKFFPTSDSFEESEADNVDTRTETRDLASSETCQPFEEKMDSPSNVIYSSFGDYISQRILENASTIIPSEALINVNNPSSDSLEESKTDKAHTRTENRDLASGDACHAFEEKMDSSSSVMHSNFGNDISQRILENASTLIPSSKTDEVRTRTEDGHLASGDAGRPLEEKINGYFRRGESGEITEMMMPALEKTRERKNDVSLQQDYSNAKTISESDTKKNIISESSYTHPQKGSTFNDAIPSRKCDLSSNQPFFNKSMGNNKELKDDSGEGYFSLPEKYSEVITQEKSSQPLPSNSNSSLEIGDTPLNAANEIKVEHHMEAPSGMEDNILSEREIQQSTQTGLEIIENKARNSNLEVENEGDDNEVKVESHMEASPTVESCVLSETEMQQDIPTGVEILENEAKYPRLEVTNEGDANELEVESPMEASSTVEDNILSETEMQQDTPTGLEIIGNDERESSLEVTTDANEMEVEYHMEASSSVDDVLMEEEMEQDTPTELQNVNNTAKVANVAPKQVTSHIDNDVSKIILSALKSKNFVNGGTMTELAKHLKKELNHRTSSKLKQELQAFLNHAVNVNTLELRKKRYFLTAVSKQKKGKSKR